MGLKDKLSDLRVRRMAARNDGRGLLDAYFGGESWTVESVLRQMEGSAVEVLANALSVAKNDDEIEYALMKLGHMGDPEALGVIERAMSHESASVRMHATRRLSQSGTAAQATSVLSVVSDSDEGVRKAALEALEQMSERYGAGELPAEVARILAAERERSAAQAGKAHEAAIAAPLPPSSAAKLLIEMCDGIDQTYVEPVRADADDRRRELKADIERMGHRLHDEGGESLMLEVANLVHSASSHGNFLSREWSGIGRWRG